MIFQVEIIELIVNDIQLKFGEDSDKQGFRLDGNNLKCNDSNNKMTTAFVRIKNEKVVSSICKNSGGRVEHLNYNQELRKKFTVSRLLSRGHPITRGIFSRLFSKWRTFFGGRFL